MGCVSGDTCGWVNTPKTTAHADVLNRKKLIQLWSYMHSHHALCPCLKFQNHEENFNFCSPQCAFATIQSPVTQGQGEGMEKLHTMNLVVACFLLILTWDLLSILLKIRWDIHNISISLIVPFPSFQVGKKIPWDFGQFPGACGMGRDSWKISGTWDHCTLDKVMCLNHN